MLDVAQTGSRHSHPPARRSHSDVGKPGAIDKGWCWVELEEMDARSKVQAGREAATVGCGGDVQTEIKPTAYWAMRSTFNLLYKTTLQRKKLFGSTSATQRPRTLKCERGGCLCFASGVGGQSLRLDQ